MVEQGFYSLFIHQKEELRNEKKQQKQQQQQRLQKGLRWNSVNTATCGPWKFIRIDGSKAYHSLVLHTCAL